MAVIFDIKRFAVHDGPGIRTTIFMKGCWLSCKWCHNPESMNASVQTVRKKVKLNNKTISCEEQVGKEMSLEELMPEIEKEMIFMNESGGGVTFSGGEPFFQSDFLISALKACKSRNIHTSVDTSGYAPWELIEQAVPFTDLFLFDLKVMDDELHRKFTGVSNKVILENLEKLIHAGAKVRIRLPLVPGISMEDENIDSILKFLESLDRTPEGVDLLPYHNTARHKYENFRIPDLFPDMKSVNETELDQILGKFTDAGFAVSIGG